MTGGQCERTWPFAIYTEKIAQAELIYTSQQVNAPSHTTQREYKSLGVLKLLDADLEILH
jgi:hypothetical protein